MRGADAFGLPADGPPAVTVDRIRYVHPLTARFLAACRRVFGGAAGPSHVLQPGSGDAAGLHWVSNARILRSSAAAAAIDATRAARRRRALWLYVARVASTGGAHTHRLLSWRPVSRAASPEPVARPRRHGRARGVRRAARSKFTRSYTRSAASARLAVVCRARSEHWRCAHAPFAQLAACISRGVARAAPTLTAPKRARTEHIRVHGPTLRSNRDCIVVKGCRAAHRT